MHLKTLMVSTNLVHYDWPANDRTKSIVQLHEHTHVASRGAQP